MKKNSPLLFLVCLLSLPLVGQSVKIKSDNGVDMTKYESFTVMKGEVMTPRDERKMDEDALFSLIEKAVITEMESKGYKFLSDSSAQLYVSYVAGAYDVTAGGSMGPLSQMPASTPSDMNQSRSWSHESREGMMVIDITDAHSKKEIWSATGSLSLENVDINRALDAVIYKAFKKFPNKNRKKKK